VIGYNNVEFRSLANCDHNLSNAHSRKAYLDAITDVVKTVSAQDDVQTVVARKKTPEIAKAIFSLVTSACLMVQSKLGALIENVGI